MNQHAVTAIGTDSRRVTLLVVPPDKPTDAAEAALRTASDSNGTTTVEGLLAGNGDRATR